LCPAAFGREICAFDDRFILYGGPRLAGYGLTSFSLFGLNATGDPVMPEFTALSSYTVGEAPAWDNELMATPMVIVGEKSELQICCLRKELFTKMMDDKIARAAVKTAPLPERLHTGDDTSYSNMPDTNEFHTTGSTTDPAQLLAWHVSPRATMMALTPNAVVALQLWENVAVFDRITGKPLANVDIHGGFLPNGLCIDRDGRIIVVSEDGKVTCVGAK